MTITTQNAPVPRVPSNEAVFIDDDPIGFVGETGRGDWFAATKQSVRYQFKTRKDAIGHLVNLKGVANERSS